MNNSSISLPFTQNSARESLSFPFFMLSLFTIANYFPPHYYYGPHLHGLPFYFGVLAGTTLLIQRLLQGQALIKLSLPIFFIIIVYFFLMYSTFVVTVDSVQSKKIFTDFSKGVILFFLIGSIISNFRQLKWYLFVIAASSFWLSYRMVNYAEWKLGRAFVTGTYFASDPNDFTVVVVYSIPIVVSLIYIFKNKFFRIILIYFIFIMFLGIVEAQSRGGFLALSFSFLMLITQIKGLRNKVIALVLISLFGGIFLARYVPDAYIFRMKEIRSPESDVTGSAEIRKENMDYIFQYVISNPFSQYGLGNHSHYLANIHSRIGVSVTEQIYRGSTQVHNTFLQFGGDNGFIPLIFYLGFYISIFYILYRSLIIFSSLKFLYKKEAIFITKALLVSMSGFTAGSFFLPMAYRFFIFYIAGISIAIYSVAKNEQNKELLNNK